MIRLLALVAKEYGRGPSQRFRLEQWAPHLERTHGIQMEYAVFESPALSRILYLPGHTPQKILLTIRDAIRRLAVIPRSRDYDAVVILREATMLGGAYIERAIRAWTHRPIILDFDDAIWTSRTAGANGMLSLARMPWKVKTTARIASAVTVGNEFLADYARQFNREVHIVRTSVDLDRFVVTPPPAASEPFTIVWTGSHSTLVHLEMIRGAIERVAQRIPTVVRVVCDVPPPPFEHARLVFVPWSPEVEASALGAGHVGVMPLPDTMEARGKCGCKALQYMAVGRTAIVAPVGINTTIIQHDVNGMHATTEDEWTTVLLELAADPARRDRLAAAGRHTAEGEFSAEAAARAFAVAVHTVVGGGRR